MISKIFILSESNWENNEFLKIWDLILLILLRFEIAQTFFIFILFYIISLPYMRIQCDFFQTIKGLVECTRGISVQTNLIRNFFKFLWTIFLDNQSNRFLDDVFEIKPIFFQYICIIVLYFTCILCILRVSTFIVFNFLSFH